MDNRPISSKALGKKNSKVFLFIFFGIFAIIGLVASWFVLIRPVKNVLAARSWIETPCKIVSAKVESHRGDDSTTYSVEITYAYEFDNRQYTSDRYSFMGGSSGGRSRKQAVVDKYKKATNPVCFVDPEKPESAVLVRGFHLMMLIGLLPVVFFVVGVGGIVGTARKSKRGITAKGDGAGAGGEWLPETKTAQLDADNIYAAAPVASTGPVVLQAKSSRLSKLIGLTVFAVFWNGIISVFVVNIVKGFQEGRPQWGVAAFLSIFVLIGLAVIVGVIHQFLAMFNPKTQLTLSSVNIPLGSAAHLKWEMIGAVNRISELVITLTGREECRYRRGTKTYTDKNTFFEFEIASAIDPVQMAFGEIGFAIPADTMHSFEADNNKIIWSLNVKGDIKKWPDISDTFDITITPQQADN